MEEPTSFERVRNTLDHHPVDRVATYEDFWGDTIRKWRTEGKLGPEESPHDRFDLDIRKGGWIGMVANADCDSQLVEETQETKLIRNPDGALLRWHKQHASTPEHVDFAVCDRDSWNRLVREPLLDESLDECRIDIEGYREKRQEAHRQQRFFFWAGINVFESMHPMCGHENMLMGMALDPEWVRDMCEVYSDVIIRCQEKLFAAGGKPDGIWFYEDMGFKNKPFMSPQMYREIVQEAHRKTFAYAHSLGLKVMVHSCGYVAPLVEGLIEAGMDMLQAMEVKAGMDLVELKKAYADRIGFCGDMDVRTMTANDREAIDRELEAKLPAALEGGGYILHSDHTIPDQVEMETYEYFLNKGREMSRSFCR